MSERRRTEQASSVADALLQEHYKAFWGWKALSDAAQQIAAARDALKDINEGLDRSTSRFYSLVEVDPITVYQEDHSTGTFTERSSLRLIGGFSYIIGDRLEEIEGQLAIVDTERGVAFSVKGVRAETLESISQFRRPEQYENLLATINDTPVGQHTEVDRMWL